MLSQIRFTCTALNGTGKKGKLTPDKDGYYAVPLGALNTFNSSMEYYPYDECKALFEKSGLLIRRAQKGVLNGELGHPKFEPGMTAKQYVYRCSQIYESNWCFNIRDIWLDFDNGRDADGKPIILIMGLVRGKGPHAATFNDSMENSLENTCFSVRSFTDDYVSGGKYVKVVREIVTWDLVNEPGIAYATKYGAPTLESFSGVAIQKTELDRLYNELPKGIGQEADAFDLSGLYKVMGWATPNAHSNAARRW